MGWAAGTLAVVAFDDDLLADGEPEAEHDPGIAARLPRKTVAAGALFRDRAGRLLFVEPTYKPYLEIPGGVADAGEPPRAACRREVREELGVDLPVGRLLVVDWVPARGVWPDGVMFVFDGGTLDEQVIASLVLPGSELAAVRLLTLAEAEPSLRPSMARRLAVAVEAVEVAYLEFGR